MLTRIPGHLKKSLSLHMFTPIQVLMASALHNEGIGEVWSTVEEFVAAMKTARVFGEKRRLQRKLWMWNHIDWNLVNRCG